MATIVTRAGKGSALTFAEGDANFTNLNNDKIESLSEDTTPALGGNLDVGTNSIFTNEAETDLVIAVDDGAVDIQTELLVKNFVTIEDTEASGFGSLSSGATTSLGLLVNDGDDQSENILVRYGNGILLNSQGNGVEIIGDVDVVGSDDTGVLIGNSMLATFATTGFSIDAGDTTWATLTIKEFVGGASKPINAFSNPGMAFEVVGGTPDSPAAVVSGKRIGAIYGTAHIDTSGDTPTTSNYRMLWTTTENQSSTNRGTKLEIQTIDNTENTLVSTLTLQGATVTLPANNLITTSETDGDISIEANGLGSVFLDGQVEINTLKSYVEKVYEITATSGTIAPDAANGPIQVLTPTGNFTINGFSNPQLGQTITIIVNNSEEEVNPTFTSSVLFAGGNKTLTDSGIDIITITCLDDTPTEEVYVGSIANDFS